MNLNSADTLIYIKKSWLKIFNNPILFTNVLTTIYFIAGLIAILNHSPWRDEINPWLISRDSNSLSELFHNVRYEGHPFLWYMILYALNYVTHNPIIMQVFHLLISTLSIYIFLRFSPFKQLHKLLFIIGYYPLYEYLLISRNYAIGILFLFTFCALFPDRHRGYFRLAVLLFLMANSNAYAMLLSSSLGLTLIVDYFLSDKKQNKWNLLLSLLIFIGGLIMSVCLLFPPEDSVLAGGRIYTLNFDWLHLVRSIPRIWNAYIVILTPSFNQFWTLSVFSVISIIIFVFFAINFISKPVVLFLYAFGTIEIIFFTYVKFFGVHRHYGHLYLLLIVCFWLSYYFPKSTFISSALTKIFSDKFTKLLAFVNKKKTSIFTFILCLQAIAGILSFSTDVLHPFSASKAAANYILEQKINQLFIVGTRDYAVSPISGYINRKIYYPEIGRMGSFVLFTKERKEFDDKQKEQKETLDQSRNLLEKHPQILLILTQKLEINYPELRIVHLKDFTNSVNHEEKYFLYLVSKFKTENQKC